MEPGDIPVPEPCRPPSPYAGPRPEALASQLGGRNIAEISALGLGELHRFAAELPAGLPAELTG